MSPDDTDAMHYLANTLIDSKDHEEGLKMATQAVVCNPQNGHADATPGRAPAPPAAGAVFGRMRTLGGVLQEMGGGRRRRAAEESLHGPGTCIRLYG